MAPSNQVDEMFDWENEDEKAIETPLEVKNVGHYIPDNLHCRNICSDAVHLHHEVANREG